MPMIAFHYLNRRKNVIGSEVTISKFELCTGIGTKTGNKKTAINAQFLSFSLLINGEMGVSALP